MKRGYWRILGSNGQSIRGDFLAELSLQIRQLLLENINAHQDDVLRSEGATSFDVDEKFVGLSIGIISSLI